MFLRIKCDSEILIVIIFFYYDSWAAYTQTYTLKP